MDKYMINQVVLNLKEDIQEALNNGGADESLTTLLSDINKYLKKEGVSYE